jgi:hypothetical protein
MRAAERSLVDDLSLIDIRDGLYWQRDGSVGLLFRVTPHDEPSLAEDDFTSIALQADNVWSAMPEGSSYQWIVCVDHRDAVRRIERALPPIPNEGATAQLLEEMRQYRVRDLLAPPADGVGTLIQDRRHFFTASFTPLAWRRNNSRLGQWLRGLKGLVSGAAAHRSFDRAYDEVLLETASFERRVMTQLQQQGLALRRATTQEMVGCVYEFLNPRAARSVQVEDLSDRSRWARDGLTTSVVSVLPYLGDTSPVWSAHDDDMLVRREYLEVGDRFVSVISLKELPDSTTPGMTTPLLRLPRSQYRVVYRVDIPSAGVELAAL